MSGEHCLIIFSYNGPQRLFLLSFSSIYNIVLIRKCLFFKEFLKCYLFFGLFSHHMSISISIIHICLFEVVDLFLLLFDKCNVAGHSPCFCSRLLSILETSFESFLFRCVVNIIFLWILKDLIALELFFNHSFEHTVVRELFL